MSSRDRFGLDEEPVGADAARLLYADDARRLSDFARRLVATGRDHAPGDYIHEALLLLRHAEHLAELAIVVERARGATWNEIGAAAGGITKQSAQRRWADAAETVDALTDGIGADALRSRKAATSRKPAEDLDAWYLRHLEPGDVADDTDQPVSGYLDNRPTRPCAASHGGHRPADESARSFGHGHRGALRR
ncbi:hypothetical protein P3102_34050 [Amycolatopsis sp. QT-25]|uniref:hypothetical protein n=1 Tax=Amycolatopsis sp. QT-25 TaxID=3034022 RepID=UPI0023ED71A7|nr:hypothetical protein [Amycolatopsis sp. QT-25]WET79005.1 hypothetical protein P3102_34050 [Amycolatopsis sp. QT-25]